MRPEPMPAEADERSGPLVLRFDDLFDHAGTLDLRYSASVRELSGREVVIEGYLSQSHGPQRRWSLVDQQGVCPDCSPVPAIALPGRGRRCEQGTRVRFGCAGGSTTACASTMVSPRCCASTTRPSGGRRS